MPTTFSLAEREREYSPSSCIGGNYQPCLQEYADRSAATPAACTVHRDLAYGEKLSERLDLFLPTSTAAASQPVALLVFIHGGYWQELSKASSLFAAAGCIEAGVAFAAIDYTLAPPPALQRWCRNVGAPCVGCMAMRRPRIMGSVSWWPAARPAHISPP